MILPERHDTTSRLKVAVLATSASQFVQLKSQLQPYHVDVVCEIMANRWQPGELPGQVDVLLVEMNDEEQMPESVLDSLLEQIDPPVLFNDSDTARFASMRSGEQVWGRKLAEKLRALALAPRPRPRARVQPGATTATSGRGGTVREVSATDAIRPPQTGAQPIVQASPRPALNHDVEDGIESAAPDKSRSPAPAAPEKTVRRDPLVSGGSAGHARPGPVSSPPVSGKHHSGDAPEVWVLAASIGGPQVVKEFLAAFESPVPVIFVLAQHIGAGFIRLLAEQLDQAGVLNVSIAEEGVRPKPGHVYVAPVDHELGLTPEGRWRLRRRTTTGLYAPNIDQVMQVLAEHFIDRTHAIVFSGMGGDGLEGCRYIHRDGGEIWVQEPHTCVVSAMVDAVRQQGLDAFVGSPRQLAQRLAERLREEARKPS